MENSTNDDQQYWLDLLGDLGSHRDAIVDDDIPEEVADDAFLLVDVASQSQTKPPAREASTNSQSEEKVFSRMDQLYTMYYPDLTEPPEDSIELFVPPPVTSQLRMESEERQAQGSVPLPPLPVPFKDRPPMWMADDSPDAMLNNLRRIKERSSLPDAPAVAPAAPVAPLRNLRSVPPLEAPELTTISLESSHAIDAPIQSKDNSSRNTVSNEKPRDGASSGGDSPAEVPVVGYRVTVPRERGGARGGVRGDLVPHPAAALAHTALTAAGTQLQTALTLSAAAAAVTYTQISQSWSQTLRSNPGLRDTLSLLQQTAQLVVERGVQHTEQLLLYDDPEHRHLASVSAAGWERLALRCLLSSLSFQQRQLLQETRDDAAPQADALLLAALPASSELRVEAALASEDEDELQYLIARLVTPPRFAEQSRCQLCKEVFTGVRRRHHCRHCGASLCAEHSAHRRRMPRIGLAQSAVRCCSACAQALDETARQEARLWRESRVRAWLARRLLPYSEQTLRGHLDEQDADRGLDKLLRVADASLSVARSSLVALSLSLSLPSRAAIETLRVLRRYGLTGFASLLLTPQFVEAIETLKQMVQADRMFPAVSLHEVTACVYYKLAIDRGLRGCAPDAVLETYRDTFHAQAFRALQRLNNNNNNHSNTSRHHHSNNHHNRNRMARGGADEEVDEEAAAVFRIQSSSSSSDSDDHHHSHRHHHRRSRRSRHHHSRPHHNDNADNNDDEGEDEDDEGSSEDYEGVRRGGARSCRGASDAEVSRAIRYAPLALEAAYAASCVDMRRLGRLHGAELLATNLIVDDAHRRGAGSVAQEVHLPDSPDLPDARLPPLRVWTPRPDSGQPPSQNIGQSGSGSGSGVVYHPVYGLFVPPHPASDAMDDGEGGMDAEGGIGAMGGIGRREAVLAIRGTQSVQDLLTDLRARPVRFPAPDAQLLRLLLDGDPQPAPDPHPHAHEMQELRDIGDDSALEDAYTCEGMAGAAQSLFAELAPTLLQLLLSGRVRSVCVSGHSLGAAVGALFLLMWRRALSALARSDCAEGRRLRRLMRGIYHSNNDDDDEGDDEVGRGGADEEVRRWVYEGSSAVLFSCPSCLSAALSDELQGDTQTQNSQTTQTSRRAQSLEAEVGRLKARDELRARRCLSVVLRDDALVRVTPQSCRRLLRELLRFRQHVFRHVAQDWQDVLGRARMLWPPRRPRHPDLHPDAQNLEDYVMTQFDPDSGDESSLDDSDRAPDSDQDPDSGLDPRSQKRKPRSRSKRRSGSGSGSGREAVFWQPGRVLQMYMWRGQWQAAVSSRSLGPLRRLWVQGHVFEDHRSANVFEALLETRHVLRLKAGALPHTHPGSGRAGGLGLPPVWASFASADRCACCRLSFTWHSTFRGAAQQFRERFHCRSCGQLVCGPCSAQRRSVPRLGMLRPRRVCDTCLLSGAFAA